MTLGEKRKQLEINLAKQHGPSITKDQMIKNRKLAYQLTKDVDAPKSL